MKLFSSSQCLPECHLSITNAPTLHSVKMSPLFCLESATCESFSSNLGIECTPFLGVCHFSFDSHLFAVQHYSSLMNQVKISIIHILDREKDFIHICMFDLNAIYNSMHFLEFKYNIH